MLWRFVSWLCVTLYTLLGGVIGLSVAKDSSAAFFSIVLCVLLGLALGAVVGLAITGKLKRKNRSEPPREEQEEQSSREEDIDPHVIWWCGLLLCTPCTFLGAVAGVIAVTLWEEAEMEANIAKYGGDDGGGVPIFGGILWGLPLGLIGGLVTGLVLTRLLHWLMVWRKRHKSQF